MKKEDLKRANKLDDLLEFASWISEHKNELVLDIKPSDAAIAVFDYGVSNLIVELLGEEFLKSLKHELKGRINARIIQRFDEIMKEFESI